MFFRLEQRHHLVAPRAEARPEDREIARLNLKSPGFIVGKSFLLRLLHPRQCAARERMSKRLDGINSFWIPTTRRLRYATHDCVHRALEEMDPPFPTLLRVTGTHTGRFIGLIRGVAEFDVIALNGTQDCCVTQFVEFRSEDGPCGKFRFFPDQTPKCSAPRTAVTKLDRPCLHPS